MTVHIATYATDESRKQYLHDNGRVINLGRGRPWRSYLDKIYAVKNYLMTLPKDDIVCFVDAYDVICFLPDNLEEIGDTMKGLQADILFSAETNCYPWAHVASLYPTTIGLYKYLNSGGYIGYVWALRSLFQIDPSKCPCDQGYFTFAYLNYIHDKDMHTSIKSLRIKLDTSLLIFQTAYGIPWSHFQIKNKKFYNKVSRTTPYFIHFNGNYHLQLGKISIMPSIYEAIQRNREGDIYEFPDTSTMLFSTICDEMGIPNGGVSGRPMDGSVFHPPSPSPSYSPSPSPSHSPAQPSPSPSPPPRPTTSVSIVVEPSPDCPRDKDIVAYAKEVASRFVVPDQSRIMARDQVNHHAILKGSRFVAEVSTKTMHREFAITNRGIIENYLGSIGVKNNIMLDITLHDYLGEQHNTARWPHSILGFSKNKHDKHNALIPDLYAMQNYKGMLDDNVADNLPTMKKINKMVFVGTSSGTTNIEMNPRIRVCKFAKGKDWIRAYITSVVHFEPKQVEEFQDVIHSYMSVQEQQTYRHIMVIDGHTSCWDRLPWVLASRSVCWKQESDDECWYYRFLKPWVHYIPFDIDDLDGLQETWNKVKDDRELQLRIVANANLFVEDFLTPHAHALYTRTLLDEIVRLYGADETDPKSI